MNHVKRPALLWTLFLLFLLTFQFQEGEAMMSMKLKKAIKKILLLKALTGKKGLTIIPIPIPMKMMKDMMMDEEDMKMDGKMMMMPEAMMPMPMPMPMPLPMPLPMQMFHPPMNARVVGYEVIVPKEPTEILPQRSMSQGNMAGGKSMGQSMMLQNNKYGMRMRNDE